MRLEQLRTGEHAARATEPRAPQVCTRDLQCIHAARRTLDPIRVSRPEYVHECKRESGLASAALRSASRS